MVFPNTTYPNSEEDAEKKRFLFILSFEEASLLEIDSLIESMGLNARVERADASAACVLCTEENARLLMRRLGASYKVARILGHDMKTSLERLDIPYQEKFNWTVSGYQCTIEDYLEARHELHDFLRAKRLGKSKFLEPDILLPNQTDSTVVRASELRISDMIERILSNDHGIRGIDLIVHGGVRGSPCVFAQTIEAFDMSGYEHRDFDRPFQDPTRTLSPRIARLLVNLALRAGTRSLLDPFCGLGTILQEALLCKVSVFGVDKDQKLIGRAKSNLQWLKREYMISDKAHVSLFAYDARRISKARMPRVEAIASEPILIPVFADNPKVEKAKEAIEKAKDAYRKALQEMALVLSQKNDKIAITSPVLVDASGEERTFDLPEIVSDLGLKPYVGNTKIPSSIHYPLRIDTQKRKIVNRRLNVFYKS